MTVLDLARRAKRSVVGPAPAPIDPAFANRETVFRAPPLDAHLTEAIALISPHCDYPPRERYRRLWEADQNACSWAEYDALEPLFERLARPRRILEIGPGMGRSLVFLAHKRGWAAGELHAYEGDGRDTRYTILGPRIADSFCGDIGALRRVLDHNGVDGVTIHDADEVALRDLPGPFDLIYSFYSVGFHWSVEHFLDDVLALMDDDSTALFITPGTYTPSPAIEALEHELIAYRGAFPPGVELGMLALRKTPFPA